MSNAIDVTFRFTNAAMASDFLGYMSDGGGEYRFIQHKSYEGISVEFDYHKLGSHKPSPGKPRVVVVTSEGRKA